MCGRFLCVLVFSGFSQGLFAQTFRLPGFITGIGACSRNYSNVFSFTVNPAALAALKQPGMAVYGERKFLLPELGGYAAAIAMPAKNGNFGLKAAYSGFSDYNETELGLAYARSLGKKLDAGIQFLYHGTRIASGYGSASGMNAELGILVHITEQLHTGIQVRNPATGLFGKNHPERAVSVYQFGMGYEFSEKFFIGAVVVKEEDRPVNLDAGFQYNILPRFWIKAGVATSTASIWAGVGLSKGKFNSEFFTEFHPQLGITPGLLLSFEWGREKE